MLVWYSDKSTDPGARLAWIHLIQILLLTDTVTSGRSFNISDAASVKCRGALRISKNVCKSPSTVSGTYYAFTQRLIPIAVFFVVVVVVVVNAKEIGLETRNRFICIAEKKFGLIFRKFLCVMLSSHEIQMYMVLPKENGLSKFVPCCNLCLQSMCLSRVLRR